MLWMQQSWSFRLVSDQISTCWLAKSCQKYGPAQNTTTQNTQQPTRDSAALPPNGVAIFRHGNIRHGSKSWRRWSLWAHTRHSASGALSLLFVPSFGAPKRNTSKIRERNVTLALGGHLLVRQHNNQPKVGVRGRRDIGEGAWSGRNVWGGRHTIVWGGNWATKKWKK